METVNTTAKVKETFVVLELNEDGGLCVNGDSSELGVDQFIGETLEVWKRRADGFCFVYSDRLEIGYWVNPMLIEIQE